jgi:hypothetical protein
MHPGGRVTEIGLTRFPRTSRIAPTAALLMLALAVVTGCSSGSHQASNTAAKVVACGTAKTAANVPVHVEIDKGTIGCSAALVIERKYAIAIRSGKVPGNGGGGPVKIDGWTCQGYTTPVVLHTGKASRCVQGSNEILEILATTT